MINFNDLSWMNASGLQGNFMPGGPQGNYWSGNQFMMPQMPFNGGQAQQQALPQQLGQSPLMQNSPLGYLIQQRMPPRKMDGAGNRIYPHGGKLGGAGVGATLQQARGMGLLSGINPQAVQK